MATSKPDDDRSLVDLLTDLPNHISALVRAEFDQIKAETTYKAKHFGIGTGMLAAAAFVAVFLLGTLIATLILVLAIWLPAWAAALIVSGLLILVIAVLVFIGMVSFRKGSEPLDSLDSFKRDMNAVKGVGEYGRK
ncbi:MAG TPA: phage holin family protein [Candidatus Lumbricidophila sp.]|nr:phage holin family protein [Candidatus Lumbricidophila sp.]